jgi:hypothetical protein
LHPGRDAAKACLEIIKPQLQWSCLSGRREARSKSLKLG